MPGVYSGPGGKSGVGTGGEAVGAERWGGGLECLSGWSQCPLRAHVLPTGQCVGWCSLGADALPARRALPHFLSCKRAWVWSDWHGPLPANYYETGGGRETGPGAAFLICVVLSPLLGTPLAHSRP